MRPMYETPEDLNQEMDVARALELAWKCTLTKLPVKYQLDYAVVRSGEVTAFLEIKTRNYTWQQIDAFGGYLLSLGKWECAERFARVTSRPFILIVRAKDGLYYSIFNQFNPDGVLMRGREDRNDWQDIEPCVLLHTSRFTKLVES